MSLCQQYTVTRYAVTPYDALLAPYCLFSTRLVLGVRTTRHVADSAMIFQLHCIKDLQELTEHTHTPSDNSLTTPPRRGIKRVVAKHSEDPDSHT